MRTLKAARRVSPSLTLAGLVLPALVACGEKVPPGPPFCPGVAMELVRPAPSAPDEEGARVSVANLRLWVDLLAAPELRGRHATSADSSMVAALLADRMSDLGLEAPFAGSYCQAFPVMEDDGYNVVGHLGAEGLSRTAILLGAHYDGQGMHPAQFHYPSADDNASGVAALLEVARLARRRDWPFDLVLMATGAEEIGRVGAAAWARHPSVPLENLALAVNLDMVGRPWPADPAAAIGYLALGEEPESVAARLGEASAASGVEVRPLAELFAEQDLRSDSAVYRRHAPTLYLSTGLHEDHHQPTDTPGKVDPEQIGRTVRLTLALLEILAEGPPDRPLRRRTKP